jgi:hypothetical protein
MDIPGTYSQKNVMAGHSRPKDGVACALAYDPAMTATNAFPCSCTSPANRLPPRLLSGPFGPK